MQLPVIVVGRHDYDTYKDALERLKDTGKNYKFERTSLKWMKIRL